MNFTENTVMRKRGSVLLELVVALGIGLTILLQMTFFLTATVQRLHAQVKAEQAALREGTVLDLLMRDLRSATQVERLTEQDIATVHSMQAPQVEQCVTWRRVKGRLHRVIRGKVVAQVFGEQLQGLAVDGENRLVRFIDEQYAVQTVCF